jgi:hypothetical protein
VGFSDGTVGGGWGVSRVCGGGVCVCWVCVVDASREVRGDESDHVYGRVSRCWGALPALDCGAHRCRAAVTGVWERVVGGLLCAAVRVLLPARAQIGGLARAGPDEGSRRGLAPERSAWALGCKATIRCSRGGVSTPGTKRFGAMEAVAQRPQSHRRSKRSPGRCSTDPRGQMPALPALPELDVEVRHELRVCLDVLASGLDVVAHESLEEVVREKGVLHRDA